MDYYQILGISQNADDEAIKKAYRVLAKQYHPDRNPGDKEAEEKFKEVSEAFEVLSDSVKRAEYNSRGYVSGRGFKQEYRKSTGNSTERDEAYVHSASHRYKASQEELDSVHCSFFGGSDVQGRNVLIHFAVPKSELHSGCVKGVKWKKRVKCKDCDGYGSADLNKSNVVRCKACAGSGNVMKIPGKAGLAYPKCDFCDGSGIMDMHCRQCKGTGLAHMEIEEMMIEIPIGTQPGHQIVIRGRGEPGPNGGMSGNLHVIVLEQR